MPRPAKAPDVLDVLDVLDMLDMLGVLKLSKMPDCAMRPSAWLPASIMVIRKDRPLLAFQGDFLRILLLQE